MFLVESDVLKVIPLFMTFALICGMTTNVRASFEVWICRDSPFERFIVFWEPEKRYGAKHEVVQVGILHVLSFFCASCIGAMHHGLRLIPRRVRSQSTHLHNEMFGSPDVSHTGTKSCLTDVQSVWSWILSPLWPYWSRTSSQKNIYLWVGVNVSCFTTSLLAVSRTCGFSIQTGV